MVSRRLAAVLVGLVALAIASGLLAILVALLWRADQSSSATEPPPSYAVGAAAQVLAAVAMFAVALLTLWYARATQQMAQNMRASRVGASVVVFPDGHGPYVGFRVENFGAGPAEEVTVTFLDPLTRERAGRHLAEYNKGDTVTIALLAPGQIVWRVVGTIDAKVNSFSAARVKCEWKDKTGSGSVDYVIDIAPLLGEVHDASLADVVKAIKDLKP